MFNDPKGPIEHFSWGKFIINGETHGKTAAGKEGKGKDIRLIGDKVKKWKARKGHKLKPEMVEKILDKDLEILIIGIGVNGLIECPDKVKKAVYKSGIKNLILLKTPEACQKYNELYHKGKKPDFWHMEPARDRYYYRSSNDHSTAFLACICVVSKRGISECSF